MNIDNHRLYKKGANRTILNMNLLLLCTEFSNWVLFKLIEKVKGIHMASFNYQYIFKEKTVYFMKYNQCVG